MKYRTALLAVLARPRSPRTPRSSGGRWRRALLACVGAAATPLAAPAGAGTPPRELPTVVADARLDAAVATARARFLARQPFDRFDVTVLVEQVDGRWLRGAWNGERPSPPASCVKLAYLVGAIDWCLAAGRAPDCLDADVRPMVVDSDNVATGRVVDALAGAPNVAWPEASRVPLPTDAYARPAADGVVPPVEFAAWLERRRYTERVLARAGLLGAQRLTHKTWPTNSGEVPEGYERLALAAAGRNAMSPDGAARLMLALQTGALVPRGRRYARELLARERWSGQAAFGSGLPPGTEYQAKIGTAYDTLQEIAFFSLPDGRRFVVAAFSNGWDRDEPPPYDVGVLGSFVEELLAELPVRAPRRSASWTTHAVAVPGAGWAQSAARGAWRDGTTWVHPGHGEHVWRVRVPRPGRYEVAAWHAGGPDRTPAARYAIEGTAVPTYVDQRRWRARWLPLGEVYSRDTELVVRLGAEAPGVLEAGAIRVSAVPAPTRRAP